MTSRSLTASLAGPPETAALGAGAVVVIPARDEVASVADVVRGARRALPGALVVVVDDGSRDATGRAAHRAGAMVVRLERPTGYAGALQAGYRAAIGAGAVAVVQLDADGQHDPADLPGLLAALVDHDVVIGSRFLGTCEYTIPVGRRAAIAACRWMARRAGGPRVSDPTSGYRALRLPVARGLARDGFPGGLTETSLLIGLVRRGATVGEVPVQMHPSRSRSMHRGLAGGARLFRISWAVFALVAWSRPRYDRQKALRKAP